jgi:hypothetical protein
MRDNKHTNRRDTSSTEEVETIKFGWGESVPPGTAVANTIAAATNRDPCSMPPLHNYVNVDSLNGLVTRGTRDSDREVRVVFPYEDHTVTVTSGGDIEVQFDTIDGD